MTVNIATNRNLEKTRAKTRTYADSGGYGRSYYLSMPITRL